MSEHDATEPWRPLRVSLSFNITPAEATEAHAWVDDDRDPMVGFRWDDMRVGGQLAIVRASFANAIAAIDAAAEAAAIVPEVAS